ncbi:hypothetical protein RJ639_043734 [Escallonia herrerae]|uniref:Embryo defective 1273 n=1 Tax=Escallonia herrerae TaxID=1293975 RepID=A0AA89B4G7_9ASTE|nr:hypothetical protein RJ639_043734 [Escallonia herrerae]
MPCSYSSTHLFTSSTPLLSSSTMALKIGSPSVTGFEGWAWCTKKKTFILNFKPNRVFRSSKSNIVCAVNMTAGESGEPGKLNLDHVLNKARKLWDSSPQPVKSFPWNRALENFIQLILDLGLAVIKYLCVPVLAVSSLSEMSYCIHEKKQFLIPFPLLLGVAVAGVVKETALELSPFLKDAEVPWHLIVSAIFFTLLKLPGPYYPHWGRILIPQFANGGLLRTLWFAVLWYRRPRKALDPSPANNVHGSLPEQEKL